MRFFPIVFPPFVAVVLGQDAEPSVEVPAHTVNLARYAACEACQAECGSTNMCFVGVCGLDEDVNIERFRSSNQCYTCDAETAKTTSTVNKAATMTACQVDGEQENVPVQRVSTSTPVTPTISFSANTVPSTSTTSRNIPDVTVTAANNNADGQIPSFPSSLPNFMLTNRKALASTGKRSVEDLKGFATTTLASVEQANTDAAALAKAAEDELAALSGGSASKAEVTAADNTAAAALAKEMEAQNLKAQLELAKKAQDEAAKAYLDAYRGLRTHELRAEHLADRLSAAAKISKTVEAEYTAAVEAAAALAAKGVSTAAATGGSDAARAEATSILHAARKAQANAETATAAVKTVQKRLGMGVAGDDAAAAPALMILGKKEVLAPRSDAESVGTANAESAEAFMLSECNKTGFLAGHPCAKKKATSSGIDKLIENMAQ